ncbi:Cyclin-dependent protein kinase inhibitor SMR13 [Hirschfeldia incana]|nr:Cyclin-dependent protein kinase inhibitor SMR13 [Hirschfeldia incana]
MPSKKATKPTRAKKKLKRTQKSLPQRKDTTTLLDHTSSSSILSSCSSTATSLSHQDPNNSIPSPSRAVLKLSPGEGGGGSGCCTPKSHKYRIPEMLTCPPAPKKQRVPQNCVLRRRQIIFFAPPEIELFFVKALDQ